MANLVSNILMCAAAVAWCFGAWSLMHFWHFSSKASQHLDQPNAENYRRNMIFFPDAVWVKDLLQGKGHDAHAMAAKYVRMTILGMFSFFLVVAVSMIFGFLGWLEPQRG